MLSSQVIWTTVILSCLESPNIIILKVIPAFLKRFVGAGHSEEGSGPGGEGTLPSARRARTLRGVWGHSPSEIFRHLDAQRCHLVHSGRILSVKIVFHLHNSIYHHFQ